MMKNIIGIFAVMAMVFVMVSCTATETKQKTIEIYGSNECSHCVDLQKGLDSAAIAYTFYDVIANDEYHPVMMEKAKNGGLSARFNFPVVDIEGDVIGGATVADVIKLLEKSDK